MLNAINLDFSCQNRNKKNEDVEKKKEPVKQKPVKIAWLAWLNDLKWILNGSGISGLYRGLPHDTSAYPTWKKSAAPKPQPLPLCPKKAWHGHSYLALRQGEAGPGQQQKNRGGVFCSLAAWWQRVLGTVPCPIIKKTAKNKKIDQNSKKIAQTHTPMSFRCFCVFGPLQRTGIPWTLSSSCATPCDTLPCRHAVLLAIRKLRCTQPSITRSRAVSENMTLAAWALALGGLLGASPLR